MGPKSETTYPATPQKGAPGVNSSVTKNAMKGGTEEVVAAEKGPGVGDLFKKISHDYSYSKTV